MSDQPIGNEYEKYATLKNIYIGQVGWLLYVKNIKL